MIKLLAAHGAHVNGLGGKDNSPLHFAVAAVAATKDRPTPSADQEDGGEINTTVTSEEQQEQLEVIRCLLSLGANSYIPNRKGLSPFVTAALMHRWDIADEIISEEKRRNLNSGDTGEECIN